MMSEPKRLHPITIFYEIMSALKELIIPFILFVIIGNSGDDSFWNKVPLFIFILLIVAMIVSGFIKWLRFTYWLEDQELRITQGLFVRKKRYIPFERIQSLDLSEGIFHRPFQLVKVKVETAASSDNKAEAELTAIHKEEAAALQKIIADAKRGKNAEDVEEEVIEEVVYKITTPQLFFLATTSGRAGVVISAFLAFIFQFEDFIPYEKVFNEMQELIRYGVLFISAIVFVVLVIAWLISVLIAFFKYNDFTVKKVENDLIITRGLLEKRTTTVPLHRIQALKITESPIRQPFGYASVKIESAGGTVMEEDSSSIDLLPVVKKSQIPDILGEVLQEFSFVTDLKPAPKKSLRRYLFVKVLIAFVATIVLSATFWPYGLLACILIGGAAVWGYAQFRSAGWNIHGRQLTMRFRTIEQHTVLMNKNRIQAFDMSVNWFQDRADLAGVEAKVKSGEAFERGHIPHIEQEAAQEIYKWYSHREFTKSEQA
ncbi:PH domain-containing protein [Siminovitchia sp. FSL H7-0308]|nr:PH domain-containing protein [Siminovitchia thermophila]